MSVYKDIETVKKLFGEFWTEMMDHPQIGPKLKETNLSALFRINEPDVAMYIDVDGIKWDDEARKMKPVITLTMSGDLVHQFWLKKVNVAKALAKREVRTTGPITKVMKLLPLVKPGYALYREYCIKYNIPIDE